MDNTAKSITNLSSIDAENFKFRNTRFLMSKAQYDLDMFSSKEDARHTIWVVRNGDLRRVLKDFPVDTPLTGQCAHWMHAVVGKHYFPDANHRTAIALLRKLLKDNGIMPSDWDAERTREARKESHEVRAEIESIRLDTLYQQDELYDVWLSYFTDVLAEDK